MARPLVILVDLDELPKLILESAVTCFKAHGVQLADRRGIALSDEEAAMRLREMSNNVSAAVVAVGEADLIEHNESVKKS